MKLLKVLWGMLIVIGLGLLGMLLFSSETVSPADAFLIGATGFAVGLIFILLCADIFFPCHYADFYLLYLCFSVPELLYYIGKPKVVAKGEKYAIRRGFICHQYRVYFGWQTEPYFYDWDTFQQIRGNMEKKAKAKKEKIRTLSEYDLRMIEKMRTPEFLEAMEEL